MSQQPQPSPKKRNTLGRSILKASTIAYFVMGLVGFEICWWYHQNVHSLLGSLQYSTKTTISIIVASIAFLLLVQRLLEDLFSSYVTFKRRLAVVFGGLGWLGMLWIALVSAVGEEILFRGAIQPFLGLWFTSLLFGLLHMDPEGGISAWTLWAILAGVVLGSVVNVTGSLWPAIFIHFIINFIGIRSLSRIVLKPVKARPDVSRGPGAS
jgi:membrane protease YdiL (CAAX protease family)